MTKIEQLTQAATALTDEQLEGVLAYTKYLAGETYYAAASAEIRASIERGLEQQAAGETSPAADVFARVQTKIVAARS
jgi:predicted transcriptional regulator